LFIECEDNLKIAHIADVHWRGLTRHEEYVNVFNQFFEKVKELKPDVIYVGGDIVHSKTQGISPELIDNLRWWFKSLGDLCPTHVILGNHDGLILNKDRQDAITPILNAIQHPNIFLYKDSGVYETGFKGFKWCVFSCFDEEGWKNVNPDSDDINIALYHGAVRGSLTDTDWALEGEIESGFFKGYDFALLGDIHKRQFLNRKKTIAYCGSTIQQNYGEDPEKGFLFWDIRGKNDFDVEFHRLHSPYPFVTVDWSGTVENTVRSCLNYPDCSRFRIRSSVPITQIESKRLQQDLKRQKNAEEVVFKTETSFDMSTIKTDSAELTKQNLRDPEVQMHLIKEYYKDADIDEEVFVEIKQKISNYLSEISENDDTQRNLTWTINQMKFDNTFSYGSDNIINFDTLPGITGIFGKNARGKSSIIGTLVYGLFNTTDRGSIKNLHVINTRKNNCECNIDISIGGNKFRIKRKTIKKQTKSGVWAPTNLDFYKLDEAGNETEDMSDEQRRSTEKVIRSLIGSSEEFLMTSLASQGEMNTFIREKATARKNILSNFLDLQVFDNLYDLAKADSSEVRSQSKILSSNSWDERIDNCEFEKQQIKEEQKSIKKELKEIDILIDDIKSKIYENTAGNYVSDNKFKSLKEKYISLVNEKKDKENRAREIAEETEETRNKVEKVSVFLEDFNIDELKKKLDAQSKIEKNLYEFKKNYEIENRELKNIEKSVSKLETVPCGDSFPTCKFIKDSHKNKKLLDKQKKKVISLVSKVNEFEELFNDLKDENLASKIEKYNQIIQRKAQLEISLSSYDVELAQVKSRLENIDHQIPVAEEEYEKAKATRSNDSNSIVEVYNRKLSSLKEQKNDLSKKRDNCIVKITKLNSEVVSLKEQKKEYVRIRKELTVFDVLTQAVSKKGIPTQLINTMLPAINGEIANILSGVVSFTVELEADLESNSMDIYINYGDSRRIIELASGMEKMISSLAIRVALINVSTMSKTNMLIIDEGFGALDETNLEACSRLLQSLKKWFRNILVISHVDMIKDTVDNNLEIMKKGKDSYVSNI